MERFIAGLLVMKALNDAQEVLARHLEPNGPSYRKTIQELYQALDNRTLVIAMRILHT